MARRGQDVIGFTRIFVLFCTLVLVPALFLSGFGVIAILNERQAERQRRTDLARGVLENAQRVFAEVLDSADQVARAAMDAPDIALAFDAASSAYPIGPWLALARDGTVIAGAPRLLDDEAVVAHLVRLAQRADPARPAHAAFEESGLSAVVSLQRVSDGRVIVFVVDDEKLDAALRVRSTAAFTMGVRVAGRGDEPVPGAAERLLELVRDKEAKQGPEELITRTLQPPFERYTLVVASNTSPVYITMIVYLVLLVVFLATLITGVVITARLIFLETRISRLKTDFVSHMSHELRTPLTSIRMFIETLKMGRATPEEQAECLQLLAKETERLSEMIERVLGYARLRAGRRLFQPAAVPVKDAVEQALDAFKAQTMSDGADLLLRTEVEADVPAVHIDREAFVEALLNLVSNAYKYSGPQKEITVFAKHGKKKGRVVVGVKDNGPGLPKQEHSRVFDRFYQAGGLLSSTKRAGSGLGLAITRAIVEGNGGKIHVESEPGKGAVFFIELNEADAANVGRA
jgi:two-component system, OmpR family, phosphate regulon sensor histidine kinase PhoR